MIVKENKAGMKFLEWSVNRLVKVRTTANAVNVYTAVVDDTRIDFTSRQKPQPYTPNRPRFTPAHYRTTQPREPQPQAAVASVIPITHTKKTFTPRQSHSQPVGTLRTAKTTLPSPPDATSFIN